MRARRAVVGERPAADRQRQPVDPLQRRADLGRLHTDPRPRVGKRRPNRRRRGLEHGDGELGAVVDHQMRTTRRADRHIRPIQLQRQASSAARHSSCSRRRPCRPSRSPSSISTVKMNWPVKNPNTSIVAVPANESSSPSRSIVCAPDGRRGPERRRPRQCGRGRDGAAGRAPLSSCAPEALL